MEKNPTMDTLTRRTGLLLATVVLGLLLASGVALANNVPCKGNQDCGGDTIETQPSEGDDVFYGSELIDHMSALGGNDVGYGRGGEDFMDGYAGNDIFYGGTGTNWMQGMEGNDTFHGGPEIDRFSPGPGNDVFHGGVGDDVATGNSVAGDGEGDDTFDGGAGNDFLGGGTGKDKLYGDEGEDTLWGSTGGDWMEGGANDDRITDYSGDPRDASKNGLFGEEGNDYISAEGYGSFHISGDWPLTEEPGADRLWGGFRNDFISGGDGNDVLGGRKGDDQLFGDDGNDVLGKPHDDDNDEDSGRDKFYGRAHDDVILARDGENDLLVDCGEGSKDVAVVDYKLGEWTNVKNCESIHDGVGPSISAWRPTTSTTDRTPTIKATVKDSHPRMKIPKDNIQLYVDGRRIITFTLSSTGVLTYTPKTKLAPGRHTVKLAVKEAELLTTTKYWTFVVK